MEFGKEYIKAFDTEAEYLAFKASSGYNEPNVSYIVEGNRVHYNPYVETMVVAKYNVTTDTKTQMILGCRHTGSSSSAVTTAFTSVYVDGNEIEISNENINYTFDTVGEHTVKYELKDPTTISVYAFTGSILGVDPAIDAVSITMPNSVTNIVNNVFDGCSGLTSVTIGSGVTSIGSGAFYTRGRNLSEITSLRTTAITLPTSGQPVFYVASSGTLKVPTGSTGYDAWLTLLGSGWNIQYI